MESTVFGFQLLHLLSKYFLHLLYLLLYKFLSLFELLQWVSLHLLDRLFISWRLFIQVTLHLYHCLYSRLFTELIRALLVQHLTLLRRTVFLLQRWLRSNVFGALLLTWWLCTLLRYFQMFWWVLFLTSSHNFLFQITTWLQSFFV